MDGIRFALGVAKKKTRQEKRAENLQAFHKKMREQQRHKNRLFNMHIQLGIPIEFSFCQPFILKNKRWFLLKGVPNHVDVFMYNAGDTGLEIIGKIKRKIKYGCETDKHRALLAFAIKNQRVRRGFEALARHWIRSRFRAGNEEDLLTGAVPEKPIVLMDWKVRRRYVFEPSTLFKDMLTRLLMSYCDVFARPQYPRNPYTNTDMSAGQFFSVVTQLRSVGVTHWTLEALYSVEYNLKTFETEMALKLKSTILHNLFSNHKSIAGIDTILEFIEEEHGNHGYSCDSAIYRWGLENAPTHSHIVGWRNLCYKYYKTNTRANAIIISRESHRLCILPVGLIATQRKLSNTVNRTAQPA
jgi:hypothetical protein